MDFSVLEPFVQIFAILKIVFGQIWQFVVPPFLFTLVFITWVYYRQGQYLSKVQYSLLVVNVPPENLRTPFAAEQIMAGLHGILAPRDLVEKYWVGEIQEWYSLEMISIEGNVNILIRTPKQFRDLVEAHVYAQYPDAEIYEVQDYTQSIADEITHPDSPWDLWGAEMQLAKEDGYPIKTYIDFEMATQAADDEAKIDPLAGVLELLSSLGPGEQMWIQIPIQPAEDSWKDEGEKIVKELIGAADAKKPEGVLRRVVRDLSEVTVKALTEAAYQPPTFAGVGEAADKPPPSLMQYLSPGQQEVVKAIERNISKVAFCTKVRMIYLMHREVYNKDLLKARTAAFMGAYTHFATIHLNTFVPKRKTSAHYWFPKTRLKHRKRQILKEYKSRSLSDGSSYFLNIEELATLFHFPTATVKAPMVETVEVKKAVPPRGLPFA